MKIKKYLLLVTVLLCLLALSVVTGYCQTVRLSHEMSPDPDIASHAFMMVLEHYLEAGTDIEAEIYPANVLGGQEAVIEQLQEGDIQVAQLSLGGISHYYPKALIYTMFYAYPMDEPLIRKLWDKDNKFTSTVFNEIQEEVGIKPIGIFRNGGWGIFSNNVRPINNLEDMKGLSFRAMERSQVELYRALGADGIVIPWDEIYISLQTGVVDGQMNPASIFLNASLNEVQRYITFPGIGPGVGVIAVNIDWYNDLNEKERKVLEDAFDCAFTTANGLSYRSAAEEQKQLEEKGVEVYHQTEEEYSAFREAALKTMKEWASDQWGEDFVKDFFEEIENLKK